MQCAIPYDRVVTLSGIGVMGLSVSSSPSSGSGGEYGLRIQQRGIRGYSNVVSNVGVCFGGL